MSSQSVPSTQNPPLSRLVNAFTWFEAVVLFTAGAGLTLLPAIMRPAWPWEITPFNAGFTGAIYIGSFIPVLLLALNNRWSPGRIALWQIFVFTVLALLVTGINYTYFHVGKWSMLAWFYLYIVLPINAGYHLLAKYRNWPPPVPLNISQGWKTFMLIAAVPMALYGLALLILGTPATTFWPWPIDDFHARVYSAIFLTAAVGLYLASRSASRLELVALGLSGTAFGGLVLINTLVVDAGVKRIDWSLPTVWLWMGIFAVITLIGLAVLWLSRTAAPLAPKSEQ